jgi:hypothetical protein
MEGDLTQLKAKDYSGLDKYLSASEKNLKNDRRISLFESDFGSYKIPTDFSVNTRKVTADNVFDFGHRVKFTIPRYGDKITDMMLEIELPTLSNVGYVNTIGYALIDYIELEIGGKTIDKHYNIWYDIYDKTMISSDYEAGMNEFVLRFDSHNDESFRGGKVIIPLRFWFTKKLSQSFPLLALSHQDMVVYVKLNTLNQIWTSNENKIPNEKYSITNGHLLVDYIRLNKMEKTHVYRKKRHEYLIKQLQLVEMSIPSNPGKVKISLDSINYPVTELFWVVRDDLRETEKDWFNYSCNDMPADDPVISAKITFGDKERLEEHSSKFFRMIQPFRRHARIPNDYIYMYSFATKPLLDGQPTGYCNFSELQDVYLHLNVKSGLRASKVFVFAVNYNVLIIEDGYAWLEKCVAP